MAGVGGGPLRCSVRVREQRSAQAERSSPGVRPPLAPHTHTHLGGDGRRPHVGALGGGGCVWGAATGMGERGRRVSARGLRVRPRAREGLEGRREEGGGGQRTTSSPLNRGVHLCACVQNTMRALSHTRRGTLRHTTRDTHTRHAQPRAQPRAHRPPRRTLVSRKSSAERVSTNGSLAPKSSSDGRRQRANASSTRATSAGNESRRAIVAATAADAAASSR